MAKCYGQEKASIYDSQINKCIEDLKMQRDELDSVIERQKAEKVRLQTEVERLTYKIGLVEKSLQQRIQTRANYDKTIIEAEKAYYRLVESSNILLTTVQREQGQLENVMNKNINTSDADLPCCQSTACPINEHDAQKEQAMDEYNGESFEARLKCTTVDCKELYMQEKSIQEKLLEEQAASTKGRKTKKKQ